MVCVMEGGQRRVTELNKMGSGVQYCNVHSHLNSPPVTCMNKSLSEYTL